MRLTHTLLFGLALAMSAHAQVPNYVPANGLVGWWPFNGNANDESGNGNNGTVNGATLAVDRIGTSDAAYAFDGLGQYIEVNQLSFQAFTLSAWVNMDAVDPMELSAVISNISNSTGVDPYRGVELRVNEDSTLMLVCGLGSGWSQPTTSTRLSMSTWHLLTSTNDNESIRLFIDANQIATYPISNFTNREAPVRFGVRDSEVADGGWFDGSLDDIGIWDRALNECEIQALYNSGGQGISPTPVSYSGLNSSYTLADAPVTLTGTPFGGVFIGPGVSGNTFDPASAGVGQHSIIYSYVDECGAVNSAGICTEVTLNIGIDGVHMSAGGVNVYPNPNHGQFTVELDLQGLVSIQVLDARGRLVHSEVFNGSGQKSTRILDLSSEAKGAYTVQVQNNGGSVTQTVVIE